MRVLVACEFSGVVRDAFRKRGHEAYSCDILPSERSPYDLKHFHSSIQKVLTSPGTGPNYWDLMIAHPPCTYLCNSAVWALGKDGTRLSKTEKAAAFFQELLDLPIPHICVENPVMHGVAHTLIGGKPTQYIQPYDFGDDASKKTGLWLKNLPKLVHTKYFPPRIVEINGKKYKRWGNQTDSGQNKLGPSKTRSLDRARTYQGIADAMADQWSNL